MNHSQERVSMKTGSKRTHSGVQIHSRKRTSRKIESKKGRHSRLRKLYFSFAALWGFLLGAGFLAVALKVGSTEISIDLKTLGMVASGAVLSVLGGLMAAQSYRESIGR